ncbi:hypothetical protein ES705_26557 [subsurface metagenome]
MKLITKQIALAIVLLAFVGLVQACAGSNSPQVNSESIVKEAPPTSLAFQVSDLAINPFEVNSGVEVIITASVTNTGGTESNYIAEVKLELVNSQLFPYLLSSEGATIAPGESQLLSVSVAMITPGAYKVTWGELTGEFRVVQPAEETESSNNKSTTSAPITATWIKPQVAGDTVSIPVSEVNDNKIIHFNVAVALGSEMAFMAYNIDGKLNVRANVCPPCRSIGFSLSKDTLICDTCRTTFKAKTGDGISGGCVGYPKAAVPYEISDGKIVMRSNELLVAYQNTMEPGLP